MSRFPLLFVSLCLIGILMAFGPVARGQTTEKVLHGFTGNSNGAVSSLVRDSAGNLYGTTQVGGSGGHGTVFKVDPTGKETILHNFTQDITAIDGGEPMGGLVMDSAGNLYGTTAKGGGAHGAGTFFKIDPTGNLTYPLTFSSFPGGPSSPEAGVIIDSAGNLYGTTYSGGCCAFPGSGTVFKLTPTGTLTVLYNFTGTNGDGANPRAALVMDSAGNLYGTTLNGGSAGFGTVFKVSPTGAETVLHSFTGTNGDGANPQGTLVMDSAGNLYGTTMNGGTAGDGIVFKVDSTGAETVLHSFTGTNGDGANPQAGLIRDSAGNLYGTTTHGGATGNGATFKVDPTGVETVLYSFTGTNGDGAQPQASLTLDSTGNLYGTTWLGGASGGGTIFKLNPANQETVLFSFSGLNGDGANPFFSGLIQDSAGNLYGTTYAGGTTVGNCDMCGTVFKVDPTGKETVLYYFTGTGGDGANPDAGLIMDSAGNLYGTTSNGGITALGLGTVFKLDPTGHETVLYKFKGVANGGSANGDGSVPQHGLVMDSAGNLYGTTLSGGAPSQIGTIFKVDPTGHETVLHTFTGTDGSNPKAGLIMDNAGNLYGTTDSGGSTGAGTVFKLSPQGSFTVLHSFGGTGDGQGPQGELILDSAGNLYGTTSTGGTTSNGTVFKVDAAGNETVLYSFTGGTNGDGATPQGALAMDGAGNLYGTTSSGGSVNFGTAFKLDPTGHETVLHRFTASGDGANPQAGVIRDSSGNLYGTASGGGIFLQGIVFALVPGPATTTTLTSSLNPSASGQSVTFTATVAAQGSGSPTGTVTFLDGTTTLGTGTLNASGQATLTTASLAPGTHSIVAQYGGDSTFASSTSAPLSQQVSAAQLQSITVSPNPATVAVGKTVQFTATGHYSDGSTQNLTTSVTWSSLHRTATISNAAGSQGLATGVEVEKGDTITASQGTISGTAQLTITPH